ncbi:hypothetical protein [Rhodoblastus sp.]|uniref:hypothetical protein n=1 Tax=Rhodoblastus sp. TaxID=1962975 RepID=UPI003F9B77FA
MGHLETAKALVAEHAAAVNQTLALLNQLTSGAAGAGDLAAANDVLTQEINASLVQLRELAAQHAGTAAPAAPPTAPAPPPVL